MTKKPEQPTPIIDWEPAPGVVLCKPLKREELAALYNRDKPGNLQLPDRVGKVSDSVGAGRVIKRGALFSPNDGSLPIWPTGMEGEVGNKEQFGMYNFQPGDYIAWMPFTDQLIEIDGQKYSLVGYDKIRAVRKGDRA